MQLDQQRTRDLREEIIFSTGIGTMTLKPDGDDFIIVDANDAVANIFSTEPDSLIGAPFAMLTGPRTLRDELTSFLASAVRDTWSKGMFTLYASGLHPVPVRMRVALVGTDYPGEPPYVGCTIDNATEDQVTRVARDLMHDMNQFTYRISVGESRLEEIANCLVRDFADWATIHVFDPSNRLQLAAVARRGKGIVAAKADPEIGSTGIGAVARSGIPLFDQPGSRSLPALREQMTEIVGQQVQAVASVPIASSSLQTYGAVTWAITDDQRIFEPDEILSGELVGLRVGHFIDQQRTREALTRSLHDREGFLRAAGHELRTPVVSIKGYTQLLLRDIRRRRASSEKMELGLIAMDTSVNRLASLMDNLFAMSSPHNHNLHLQVIPTSAREYVRQYVADSDLLQRGELNLDLSGMVDDALVKIDPERMSQVLDNVCANAYQFSPPNSLIHFSTKRNQGEIEIKIRDHGPGLSRADESRIFEPFQSYKSANTRASEQGIGLGLYISRVIVEQHGGHMHARTCPNNGGTVVHIFLPVSSAPDREGGTA